MNTEEQPDGPEAGCRKLATGNDDRGAGRELRAEIRGLQGDIRALERSLKVWLITAAVIQGAFNALIRHVILHGA